MSETQAEKIRQEIQTLPKWYTDYKESKDKHEEPKKPD